MSEDYNPRILVISTNACSYPGIDNAGQGHKEYSTNTYVIRVPDPVMFKVDFYLNAYKMGYDGILIASCGTDSPFKKTYEKLAARIDKTVEEMKKIGIEYERMKITAVCTVCAEHFVHELNSLIKAIKPYGPVKVAA